VEPLDSCRWESAILFKCCEPDRQAGAAQEFPDELEKTGGSISLVVDLPGDVNIGDVLSWSHMARLSAMRIRLSIEVFPEFN
jgi:hypothetical protein